MTLSRTVLCGSILAVGLSSQASAAIIVFEANGATPASITATRDAFRAAVGGGTVAAANGDFGGLRREINWDGVPGAFSDPNLFPGNFFNVNSPRGVVLSTPGAGFLVSTNAGDPTPPLFGFPSDFQPFSAQKLFTAIGSSITDVTFFLPGTSTVATTTAFGLVFVDVEVAGSTQVQFFDSIGTLLFTRLALAGPNQGLSFLGGVATAGEQIARVRITSGTNTILSNGVLGNPNDDIVGMDDFLYATPSVASVAVPEPGALGLLGLGLVALALRWKSPGIERRSAQ